MSDTSSYHVNGPARIFVGAPLAYLGLSTSEGVQIIPTNFYQPVLTDEFGPDVPAERQYFLGICHIRMKLAKYDDAVLTAVRTPPGSATEGVMPPAGTLQNTGGLFFRVLIDSLASPDDNTPWNFPSCNLDGEFPFNRGTKVSYWDLDFLALPWTGSITTPGTTAGRVLWNHDNSGKPAGF